MDDAVLLHRYAAEKSEEAFAELVRRHIDLVYSTALRQLAGDTHLAQDVAQTVFTDLARKAASLTDRTALTGWLYLGAHHAAAQVVRTEQRRRARETEATTMQQLISSDPTAATDWERVRPVLDDAMRELAEPDREAVLLRYFEQRPFADIGAALRVSEDAARMRVDRALEKLRALLAKRGVTSSVAALSAALANQAMIAAPAGLAASVTGAALAGTGAIVATGFFMSTTTAVLSAVALAAIGSTAYQFNQASRAEAVAAALGRERDNLRAQLRDTQQHAARTDEQAASLQGEVETLRAKATASAVRMNPAANNSSAMTASSSADAEMKKKRVKEEVAKREQSLDREYQALYRQLGFSSEQIEQFKALTVDNYNRRTEINQTILDQGLKPDDPAAVALFEQATADYKARIQAAFGIPAWGAIQHFAETFPLRGTATQVASLLFYTDTPLTQSQADQLVEVMWSSLRDAQGKIDPTRLNSETLLTQLGTVLSAPQLAIFQQQLKPATGK